MDAGERREEIKRMIAESDKPVSASKLAAQLQVSRQIIVGDIALLRAQGLDIVATARGYVTPKALSTGRYIGKLACQHSLEQTAEELNAIVDLGGEIRDVIVEHYLYGEMTGQLNIATRRDVEDFLERLKNNRARLLSELTGGIHLHTVSCRDIGHFEEIKDRLQQLGLLYENL